MKLLRVHIISADTCGGLLDGFNQHFRVPSCDYYKFDPLCFVGPNGSGKSQFLQVLAEIFLSVVHACSPKEERKESNPDLLFEIEYLIKSSHKDKPIHVSISRIREGRKPSSIMIKTKVKDEWTNHDLKKKKTQQLLPEKIIGYTSGENETLSLPFFVSRSGYAEEVREMALNKQHNHDEFIADTRLSLIDYSTHLEVLTANLLLGEDKQRTALLKDPSLKNLHSFRCVIQLKPQTKSSSEVKLTSELQNNLDNMKRCSTCYTENDKNKSYVFDFWINDQTQLAFQEYWNNALNLYSSFHKFAMLNDLAIPKKSRDRFKRSTKERKFATRLPEPQDEDKVFRFERVRFNSRGDKIVDYVSLSDGEHQLGQILGTFCMASSSNTLFLLDEPESHFNPNWRVKFISKILDIPTDNGTRSKKNARSSEQECILTTHSPFVPSDMSRENVFIFSKDKGKIVVRKPDIETYGTTFDTILEECFNVRPPISGVSRDDISKLMRSKDAKKIEAGIKRLGNSVEKVFLVDRLQELKKSKGK